MEQFIPLDAIQPGQELDPYTVLRLRQAALREVANENDQADESAAGAGKASVRKVRK